MSSNDLRQEFWDKFVHKTNSWGEYEEIITEQSPDSIFEWFESKLAQTKEEGFKAAAKRLINAERKLHALQFRLQLTIEHMPKHNLAESVDSIFEEARKELVPTKVVQSEKGAI